jgi:hypothetical protein
MPSPRWWDLENGKLSFADWFCDKSDLARMLVADFLLQQEEDWFLVPLEMSHGEFCRILSLKIKDVFGDEIVVTENTFHLSSPFSVPGERNLLLLSPSAVDHTFGIRSQEEVTWNRDENANLVWAINNLRRSLWGATSEAPTEALTPTTLDAPHAGGNSFVLRPDIPRLWRSFEATQGTFPLSRRGDGAGSRILESMNTLSRSLAGSEPRALREECFSVRLQKTHASWKQRSRRITSNAPIGAGWRFDAIKK